MEETNRRTNRGVISGVPREILIDAVNRSHSLSELLSYLGIKSKGGNYQTLYDRLQKEGIDYTPVLQRAKSRRGNRGITIPDTQLFASGSSHSRLIVKKRILKEKLLPYVCSDCGQPPEWRGKILSLVLDHINGIPDDHRLENLRFLCPNCNSQTPTFAGKANRLDPVEKKIKDRVRFSAYRKKYVMVSSCINCSAPTSKYSKTGLCRECFIKSLGDKKDKNTPGNRLHKRKLCTLCDSTVPYSSRGVCRKCYLKSKSTAKPQGAYPPHHELQSLVDANGYCAVGRMLGVSDNAVRKRLKKSAYTPTVEGVV